MQRISEAQELYLKLIELSSFNFFDGRRAVRDLREHLDLWDACLMTGPGSTPGIILRDMPDNHHNVDTLFITFKAEHQHKLMEMVEQWNADVVHVVSNSEGTPGQPMLRLWWD